MAEVKEPTLSEIMEQLALMRSTINEQNKVIVSLKGKVAETALNDKKEEDPTIPKDHVEHEGKEYAWQLAVFVVPGHGKMTADEAALNDEIIDLILSIPGQGILKELV